MQIKKEGSPLIIGKMHFEIEDFKPLKVSLRKRSKLISSTPIIIRIPERKYNMYKIPPEYRKRRYIFWRPCYDFSIFVKQLEENLIKKYEDFFKEDFHIEQIFEMFRFVKGPIVNHINIKGKEEYVVGSLWEFNFSYLTKKQRKILEFGVECGFGERNSFGFGFINVLHP